MYKKQFAIILFLWILLIAVFHNVAITHYIYWRFLWTDLIVHFLSGVWIALVGFWIFRFWTKNPLLTKKRIIFATLILSLVIGVFWEIFEYAIGIVEYSSRYTTDTILDIVMDILGGAVGFAIALWYEKNLDNKEENYED